MDLPSEPIPRLLAVMKALRTPVTGCPWDLEQTFQTIAPYTLEEAYEVADAIQNDDMPALREELGDLLLQVVYHSQIATERDAFTFDEMAAAIAAKMIDRHPHVFGSAEIATAEAQTAHWESRKAAERAAKPDSSALAGVARALPALIRAEKLQKRAARVGFDWPEIGPVFAKIAEELAELRHEIDAGTANPVRVQDELGDVLFAVANLARHCKIDPEAALRATNDKFERRFRHVERRIAETGHEPGEASLDQMDRYWEEAKKAERG